MKPIRTIFFGTPEFAVPALEALVKNARFEVVGAVTQPDKPTGRQQALTPSPVKSFALEHGLKVLQPAKLKDGSAQEQILALEPELAVVVAYGKIIPDLLLNALPRGFVNIHPSLLPKHRGPSPIAAAILAGDGETGVCLMVLDAEMDHGPVIACRRLALAGDETSESLCAKLTPIGADMIAKELVDYLDGKIKPAEQDHAAATFSKQIESPDAKIDWTKPVAEIDRLVRAMHGVTPTWTTLDSKLLLVHRAHLVPSSRAERSDHEPAGTLVKKDKKLAAACADGYLIIDELQLGGGKVMSAAAFLNGHKDALRKIAG